jgi:hypothetical protein
MAAALCYGVRGGGAQLCFHVTPGHDDTDRLIEVLGELRRFLGGEKTTVLWDGLPSHRRRACATGSAPSGRGWWWNACPPTRRSSTRSRPVVQPQGGGARQPHQSPLAEVIDQAHRGIERVRRTPHLAYSFLRHAGLSVS